jgi:hypothetical protein
MTPGIKIKVSKISESESKPLEKTGMLVTMLQPGHSMTIVYDDDSIVRTSCIEQFTVRRNATYVETKNSTYLLEVLDVSEES